MCTVTFIPVTGSEYILTSSRDEQTTRPSATNPQILKSGSNTLMYPKDPKGGGTWIACDSAGKTACLFNGAFKAHLPQYPYRYSRGLIVLDFFRFPDIQSFSTAQPAAGPVAVGRAREARTGRTRVRSRPRAGI